MDTLSEFVDVLVCQSGSTETASSDGYVVALSCARTWGLVSTIASAALMVKIRVHNKNIGECVEISE